ncbi:MAG: S-layer homology domain-containing protein, partial [Clostridia bacterium]|nr:S-layer homology domain-containing protein [Clostridia bacterium]
MKKNFKRVTALFLAVVLSLSLCIMASAANVTDFKDYDAKAWYADAVKAAVDNGLLYGKSATKLDPNGYLTRAEMAAIIDRAFGCYKKADISAFKDVCKTAWYYDAIAMANQMGTFEGTSKTTMAPDRNISRQEIFAVMARALQLDTEQFKDSDLSGFTGTWQNYAAN